MRYLVRCVAVLLTLGTVSATGLAQSHVQKMEKNAERQYEHEHKARLHRHRTHNRAERAAARHAYAREHKARLRRHRLILATKNREHGKHRNHKR